jgi:hypothetical protein
MKKIEIQENEKYGRLTIIKEVEKHRHERNFLCKCECGKETKVLLRYLRNGRTKSCGCLHKETVSNSSRVHGMKFTTEYKSWTHMKYRCNNPKSNCYSYYGGRGIKVCERWNNSFENFLEDVGKKPEKSYSLDRIDFNGNYEPGNVRWADKKTQANNRRPKSKKV